MHRVFRRHIALPSDHGAWVFLLSPLIIGIFSADDWNPELLYLTAAALTGFLLRQPISFIVKAYSGRRAKGDLPAAYFWTGFYVFVGSVPVLALVTSGFSFVLILAVPGILVFVWYLYLLSRRAERHQLGIDLVASGALALAAPAAFWIGSGGYHPVGWWLWLLTWLQSGASIVYAFLRLEQRGWPQEMQPREKLQRGCRALMYSSFNLGLSLTAGVFGWLAPWLWLPYLLQWLETVWGVINPATGWKPSQIGKRQLAVSTLFTIVFILVWR